MDENEEIQISAQITPNPNSLQFYAERVFAEQGSFHFMNAEEAKGSGLAEVIFELGKIESVLIGRDFITVTKKTDAEWPALVQKVIETMKNYLAGGKPAMDPAKAAEMQEKAGSQDDVSVQIKRVIDDEIRPAVARDGGDILFESFEDGVVRLHLRGACSSCPSSVMTLKLGIENRLKQVVPEVKEVIAI